MPSFSSRLSPNTTARDPPHRLHSPTSIPGQATPPTLSRPLPGHAKPARTFPAALPMTHPDSPPTFLVSYLLRYPQPRFAKTKMCKKISSTNRNVFWGELRETLCYSVRRAPKPHGGGGGGHRTPGVRALSRIAAYKERAFLICSYGGSHYSSYVKLLCQAVDTDCEPAST